MRHFHSSKSYKYSQAAIAGITSRLLNGNDRLSAFQLDTTCANAVYSVGEGLISFSCNTVYSDADAHGHR